MPKYEYTVVRRSNGTLSLDGQVKSEWPESTEHVWLNELGAQGWELVTTFTYQNALMFVFKRQKKLQWRGKAETERRATP